MQILVGDHLQPAAGEIEQFTGLEQEVGIGGAAVTLVAGRKGLVNQHAAIRQRLQQAWQERLVQIIGDDYRVKLTAGIRPWSMLEVGVAGCDARNIGKFQQHPGIAIDRLDAMPEPGQISRMAPRATGDVEYRAACTNQGRETAYPRRRQIEIVMLCGGAHQTLYYRNAVAILLLLLFLACWRLNGMKQKTIVTGVIGSDTHIVGNRILSMALEQAGYRVVALGALTPAAEFIKAAIETDAAAILVSSLYGQGELDCRGFRDLCIEAGLEGMLLYVGGNLVVGKHPWPEIEKIFLDMGFDRAAAPGTRVETVLEWLERDFKS